MTRAKRLFAVITLVSLLTLVLVPGISAAWGAGWLTPGWYSQYYGSSPSPSPQPTPEPTPVPEPTPEPEPEPTPAPQQPSYSSGWLSGDWYSRYYGQNPYQPPTQPAPQPKPEPDPTPAPGPVSGLAQEESKLFSYINQERAKLGLAPLSLNSTLTKQARIKAQDMVNNNYFSHTSPTLGKVGDMLRSSGVKFVLAAENIGRGNSVTQIHQMFMASSVHKSKIIGSRYDEVGIGVVRTKTGGYMVAEFFIATSY